MVGTLPTEDLPRICSGLVAHDLSNSWELWLDTRLEGKSNVF